MRSPEHDRGKVVVVGAGFAGLAAAVRLAERGCKVVLVEATKSGGGRARSFSDTGSGRELDNGQHLMMGCYRETLDFLRTIGSTDGMYFQRNLEVHMQKPGGRRISLSCPALPAPLHLAAGLLTMRGLGIWPKAAAMRLGLLLRQEIERPDDNETCDAWLRRMGQTNGLRMAFWDPLIWATLNDDPLVGSAAMLVAVIERAFMGTRDASRLGVPRLPLSRLYVDYALSFLRARGAEIVLGTAVRELCVRNGVVDGVMLKSGEELTTSCVVSAVPPRAFLDMLPSSAHGHPVFQDVARLRMSPIINLWLFLDQPLFEDVPFLGLVGSPFHWLFDRNRIEGSARHEQILVNCTISGARAFIDDTPESLVDLFRAEVQRYFPHRRFTVRSHRVVKEKYATISHAAGTYQRRPETVSPIRGLYMAGDWVRTGLPATIESAVQSGHQAAQAILEHA